MIQIHHTREDYSMLSFNKKYLVQKCLTGTGLILFGCSKMLFTASQAWLFYLFGALYAAGMLWSVVKRAEPEDERAIENIRKAKSHIYNLFLIILLVQEVFARWGGDTLQLTGKKVIIIFGMLQFAEYLHFLRFEKSNSYE